MQALLLFLIVAALSMVASSPLLLQAGRFFGLAQIVASGMLFLLFGVVVGPLGLGVLGPEEAAGMRPLLAVGLAVAGVLIGLNLDPRLLQALPWRAYAAAGAHSLTPFGLVAAGLFLPLVGSGMHQAVAAGAAALLGAVASISSPHFGILGVRSGRLERREGLAITVVAMLDDLFGLLALVVALVLAAGGAGDVLRGFELVGLAAGLGGLCGLLLAFLGRGVGEEELIAVLFGAVLLVAGAAAYLRLSTLVLGVACGATLSLLGGPVVQRTYKVLSRAERPVYLLLLFLSGPLLELKERWVWALLPAFVALRFLGKIAGGALAWRVGGELGLLRNTGWALVSQGGLSVCVVLEFLLLVPRPSSHLLFDVSLLAALLNEALAARSFYVGLVHPRPDGGTT